MRSLINKRLKLFKIPTRMVPEGFGESHAKRDLQKLKENYEKAKMREISDNI